MQTDFAFVRLLLETALTHARNRQDKRASTGGAGTADRRSTKR
jgi:hypothetical protein